MASGGETYDVERIVGIRKAADGSEVYKVRWQGFSAADDTWEPYDNLTNDCDALIEQYRRRKMKKVQQESGNVELGGDDVSTEDSFAEHLSEGSATIAEVHAQIASPSDFPSTSCDDSAANDGREIRASGRHGHGHAKWIYETVEAQTPDAWNKLYDGEHREVGSLYIPDRIPSETEKLLCTFEPGEGRVTRNKLKAIMKTCSVKESPPRTRSKKAVGTKKENKQKHEDAEAADELRSARSIFGAGAIKQEEVPEEGQSTGNSLVTAPETRAMEVSVSMGAASVKEELDDEQLLSLAATLEKQKDSSYTDAHTPRRGRKRGGGRGARSARGAATRGRPRKRPAREMSASEADDGAGSSNQGSRTEAANVSATEPQYRPKRSTRRVSTRSANALAQTPAELTNKDSGGGSEAVQLRPASATTSVGYSEESLSSTCFTDATSSSPGCNTELAAEPVLSGGAAASAEGNVGGDALDEAGSLNEPPAREPTRRRGRPRLAAVVPPPAAAREQGNLGGTQPSTRQSVTTETPKCDEEGNVDEPKIHGMQNSEGERESESYEGTTASLAEKGLQEMETTSTDEEDEDDEQPVANPLEQEVRQLPLGLANADAQLDCIELSAFRKLSSRREPPLTTFSEFRLALINNRLAPVLWTTVAPREQRRFDVNQKFRGKTLTTELCERPCDRAHKVDDILRQLVLGGARLDLTDDIRGRLPIHYAVSADFWCRIRTLLLLRSPVNVRDASGCTPLHLAVCSNGPAYQVVRVIYLLLEYGADVNELLKRVTRNRYHKNLVDHQQKITEKFNEARMKTLIDMSVKRTLTPVLITGMWESEMNNFIIEHTFTYEKTFLPNDRFGYLILLAIFDYRSARIWRVRMWGRSAIREVAMNGGRVHPLQANPNGFVYATSVLNGHNRLRISLEESVARRKLMVMAQVVLVQLHKPMPYVAPVLLEAASESGTDWRRD